MRFSILHGLALGATVVACGGADRGRQQENDATLFATEILGAEPEGAPTRYPIVLVHGFASNKEVNWVFPGWVTTLTRTGRPAFLTANGRPRNV